MPKVELCGQESVYAEGDQEWRYVCVKPAGHTPRVLPLVGPDGQPLFNAQGEPATGSFFDEHDYQLPADVEPPADPEG